ncbi:alpha-N-arabinofuranosidase [Pleomorphomonas diazotrophica]|uniref:non-reducing end alpha-L-arabinofuranosidase n=1 Tax=Pleomorphomonas diazotrophica TaxID=1166257 RepID=A0A1I4VNF8_9HYPH|nr:alpha-N-arabinofuranosidase [Pleomorphomonas diazotrophica]PKR89589.1 alpha-N-arabinofuranosidase [Pleomorphomonas diazotrophica]SFN02710.1 alpha-N-arabinofuranosidase [Pleomorphomonas diazotrophica]
MKANVTIHRDFTISQVDDRVYSSFLEHLGRAIYTGIYEPGHPTADADGFRGDVLDLVRATKTPYVRYPGGNFVSAYNWEDGVGPRESRPTRLDLAWRTRDNNHIGVNEFVDWCKKAGTKPMLAVNLGSRGLDAARNFIEYCNHPGGSYWSDLRRQHGWKDPHNVKLWCLGNEMDGPWQVGHKSADEYGKLANETGKAMRLFDKSVELVVCGSSHSNMPTFPDWEATVLDHTYDVIDHLSLHMYFANKEHNTLNYLAKTETLDRYIQTVSGVIDYVKAKKRSKKNVTISFDEWNVWYHSHEQDKKILEGDDWPDAPHLLEDIYNFEDVLQVGGVLNTFIRRADRVKIACIAQLVNVIAPIMTETGGPAWKQTIYYPFLFASLYGRGTSLRAVVDGPTYDADIANDVPYLDVSVVRSTGGDALTFFVVNRHLTETLDLTSALNGFPAARVVEHIQMTHPDLNAVNSAANPDNVVPKTVGGTVVEDGALLSKLPPLSYNVIRLAV